MTPFALLCGVCGLSHREAATFLGVRPDTVKSWSAGRNRTPDGVLAALRDLAHRIDRAAGEALALIAEHRPPEVELGYAADDAEAQSLGWPCVGAQAAAFGRIVAGLPDGVRVELVPRGSSVGTAAAADAHEAALTTAAPSTRNPG